MCGSVMRLLILTTNKQHEVEGRIICEHVFPCKKLPDMFCNYGSLVVWILLTAIVVSLLYAVSACG
jgi:hypothetical protein